MTQDIRYALMFLAEIAKRPWQGPVAIRQFSDSHHLSFKFLEQVVGKLRKSRILWVYRGRNGGYGLKKQNLSVADVYQALGHKPRDLFCPFPTDCRGGAECVEKELEARIVGETNDLFAKTSIVIPSEVPPAAGRSRGI